MFTAITLLEISTHFRIMPKFPHLQTRLIICFYTTYYRAGNEKPVSPVHGLG